MKRSAVRLRSLAPRNCPRIWLYSFVWGLFVCPYTFLIIKRFFDFVLYLSFIAFKITKISYSDYLINLSHKKKSQTI